MPNLPAAVAAAAREVEQFVASGGWDQLPQLFALVPTAELLEREPSLAGQLDAESELTPIAQDALPAKDLADSLGGISWPEAVLGCALAQEILVLPPEAESEVSDPTMDPELTRKIAAEHPARREARLVAAVLRDGSGACVIRLRGDAEHPDQLVEHPELAPNLLKALKETFA
ncbi:hypothetical protein D5S17_06575 [Pseudonocardiaceae bacterium YIM PH 21723]|nr:hypothetical protein D5S17_06575 [Pseudonocardiaceae bacterium YIM PH 21723]